MLSLSVDAIFETSAKTEASLESRHVAFQIVANITLTLLVKESSSVSDATGDWQNYLDWPWSFGKIEGTLKKRGCPCRNGGSGEDPPLKEIRQI